MAKFKINSAANYLNPYDYYYDKLSGNALFSNNTWDQAMKTNSIDMYIELLNNDTPTLKQMEDAYGYNYLDADRQIYALYNEKYGDKESTKKFTEKYLDENGVEQVKEYEMSEYEYTKKLLQEYRDIQIEEQRQQAIEDWKSENGFLAGLATAGTAILGRTTAGFLNTIQGFATLVEAGIDSAAAGLEGDDVDAAFRNAFVDDDVIFADDFNKWLTAIETDYSFMRDANGVDTGWGKYLGGLMNTLGEMAPSALITWATGGVGGVVAKIGSYVAQGVYYGSMWSRSTGEAIKEMPSMPTYKILANSTLKTAAEITIERLLGKAFGASASDNLIFGLKSPKNTTAIGKKALFKKIMGNAAQEGLEEVLQEYSGFLIDRAFALFDEDFGQLSDWNLQTLFDTFVLGALAATGNVTVDILTTKRIDTGEAIRGKDGAEVRNKKGKLVTKKLGKGESWLYNQNLQTMTDALSEIINDKNIPIEKRQQALGQLYVSYRNIGSVYKAIGQERFDNALQMMERINNTKVLTKEQLIDAATELINDVKSFGSLNTSESLKTIEKELAERKLRNVKSVDKVDNVLESEEQVTDVKKKLAKKAKEWNVDTLVTTENGTEPYYNEKLSIIVIPEKMEIDDAFKCFCETELFEKVKSTATDLLELKGKNNLFDDLRRNYLEYNKAKGHVIGVVSDKDVTLTLLYDLDFFEYTLKHSKGVTVSFLSLLYEISNNSVDTIKDAEIKNLAGKIVKAQKAHIINYILAARLDAHDFPFLSKVELDYIQNALYTYHVKEKFIKDGWTSLNKDEKLLLETKFKYASEQIIVDDKTMSYNEFFNKFVNKDSKEYVASSTYSKMNKTNRMVIMNKLSEMYSNMQDSIYNDKIRNVERFDGDIFFNMFLDNYNKDLTIENIVASDDSFKSKLKNDFEEQYPIYSLNITNDSIVINNKDASATLKQDYDVDVKNKFASNKATVNRISDNVVDVLKPYLKENVINNKAAKYLTLNDIFRNQDKFLNKSLNEVIDDLNDNNYSIDVDKNGNRILVRYSEELFNNSKDKFNKAKENGFKDVKTINDLLDLKNYPKIVQNIKIEFSDSKNVENHYSTKNKNIVIKKDASIESVLHEFQHALDDLNNLSGGFTIAVEYSNDVKKDMYKHLPWLKNYNDDGLKILLYGFSSGEQRARNSVINDVYFYIDKNNVIYTPWGAKYYPTANSNNKTVYKNKPDKTTSSFIDYGEFRIRDSDTVKRVSKKESKNTKLEPFANKRIGEQLKRFILNFDASQVETGSKGKSGRQIARLIKNGTLTRRDLFNILRNAKISTIDDYTFQAINNAYFKNRHVKTFAQLQTLVQNASKFYALASVLIHRDTNENTNKYEKLKSVQAGYKNISNLIKQIEETDFYNELFENYTTAYDRYSGRYVLDIDYNALNVTFLSLYDGTIDSLSHAANAGRYVAKHKYDTAGNKKSGKQAIIPTMSDDGLGDPFASLVEDSEKMKTDIRTYLLERFYFDKQGQELNTEEFEAYLKEITNELSELTDEELANRWRNIQKAIFSGNKDYLKDSEIKTTIKVRDSGELRTSVRVNRDKIIKSVNKFNKTVRSRFIRSNSDYFEFDENDNIIFKESKFPKGLRSDQLAKIEQDLKIIWTDWNLGLYINLDYSKKLKDVEKETKQLKHEYETKIKDERAKLRDTERELREQLKEIEEKRKSMTKNIRERKNEEIEKLNNKIADLKNKIEDLENKLHQQVILKRESQNEKSDLRKQLKEQIRINKDLSRTIAHKFGNVKVDITIADNDYVKTMPTVLRDIFATTFNSFEDSTVQYITKNDNKVMTINATKFFEINAEILSSLEKSDVEEIVNFFKYSTVNDITFDNDELDNIRRYNAFRMFTLAYIGDMAERGRYGLTEQWFDDALEIMRQRASIAGSELANWRAVMKRLNPERLMQQHFLNSLQIEFTESELKPLVDVIMQSANYNENDVKIINAEFKKLYKIALKKYRGKKVNIFDAIWKFQRLMMLSAPGTVIRNITSNFLVEKMDKLSELIGFAFTKSAKHKKNLDDQYQIAGVKVSQEIDDYVTSTFVESGLLELISDGFGKYDVRKTPGQTSSEMIIDLITKKINNKLFNEESFGGDIKSKKFTAKVAGGINWASTKIFKVMSDDPFINKRAQYYLKRMIAQRNQSSDVRKHIDLKHGANKDTLTLLAEAYTFAAWDFMHRPNVFTKIEHDIRNRLGVGGFFVYKQIMPFAVASWNWFIAGLDYTPIGLIKAIHNFNKIERTIEKMDLDRMKGNDSISSEFAQYIASRNIGKGVIGTIGFGIGILLMALGVLGVDDEDDKTKLKIGNTYVDISQIFGTQSIYLGASFVRGFKNIINNEGDIFDLLYDVTDNIFLDSTFSDMFNLFRYDNTFGEFLIDRVDDSVSMALPNFLKTFSTLVQSFGNFEVSYSSEWYGVFQRWAANYIPGVAYAMPKRVDPYTGEVQSKYAMPFLVELVNQMTPIKLNNFKVSDFEKEALLLDVRKSELTGRYEDIGTLDIKDKETLNVYYGNLNNKTLNRLFNNKDSYKVWDEKKEKYVTIKYNKMTDKQKKSVIERIMNDNAKYAKIYIHVQKGGKYYADDSEYVELKSLGIKNVYRATNKKKGFVK